MSSDKQLISREIRKASDVMRGMMVSPLSYKYIDPAGLRFLSWVGDVNVGGNRILRDVLVKANGQVGTGRGYAKPGMPVFLGRDARGRWQVIGPGDRVPAQGNVTVLDEDAGTDASGGLTGFTTQREVYDFYKGVTPESFFDPAADIDTLVWCRAYDPDRTFSGSDFTRIPDASGNGNHAEGTSNLPTLATAVSTNGRDGADFVGSDRLTFLSNIPGEVISIFALVNKDATGAGDDTVIQTAEYRLQSRDSSGDTWGIDAGGGFNDSGSTLGGAVVLLEAVCTNFNDIDLYEDGTFLANGSLAAAGEARASSLVGNSFTSGQTHDGKILEVLVIDRAVNTADRQAIEAYFNQTHIVNFSRYADGVTPYPKVSVFDSEGNPA